MLEIDWRDQDLLKQLEPAFTETNQLLGIAAQKAITDTRWEWPTEPSPRDIVDTGELRSSYLPNPQGLIYDHTWNTDYALAVHEGAALLNEGTMPGRPWATTALDEFDFDNVFAKIAQRYLVEVG